MGPECVVFDVVDDGCDVLSERVAKSTATITTTATTATPAIVKAATRRRFRPGGDGAASAGGSDPASYGVAGNATVGGPPPATALPQPPQNWAPGSSSRPQ